MKTIDSSPRCPKCGAPIPADAPQGLCPACVLGQAATVPDPKESGSGATEDIPALDRVRAAFPQLEILEVIGRGGMGFVFKARQPHLDRFVALKLLPDKLARDPRFAERFNREGRVLARLNHPNIVSVFDFGRTEHFYFLTMEYVDGVNLRQAMQAGRFSPTEALGIVPKICEALQYAHEQGVLHRDIKPENILLDARGRVKIADFGIAKLVGDDPASVTLTGTGAALGTPHYMAPEQLETPTQVDHRADIYSLGVVFYEMLTGELPIGRFAPPSAKTPVSSGVDEVVFRTLEKDRAKRYQSAGQVKTEVEHLTQSDTVAPGAVPPGAQSEPAGGEAGWSGPGLSRRAVWGAALTGLGLVLLGGPVALVLVSGGGLGPGELLLLGVPGALCALAGTIVGWTALLEIREARGAISGLPLAIFSALTWPVLTLVGVALGPLVLIAIPAESAGRMSWLSRGLALLWPASLGTFAIWTVYATTRWAARRPVSTRRGLLKWVFAVLLAVGLGLLATSGPDRSGQHAGHPGLGEEVATAPVVGTEPLRLSFKVPKGQIALFELCRHDNANEHQRLPGMSGFVIAPADASAPGEVLLDPVVPGPGADLASLRWAMKLLSEDSGEVGVGAAEFGPLRLPDGQTPPRLPTPLFVDSSLEFPLTVVNPDQPADTTHRLQPALGLIVTVLRKPAMYSGPESPILGGGTNWESSLGLMAALDTQRAAQETNAPVRIRFTVTNVALRDHEGARWLVMDYVANLDTNWVTVVRAETRGFEAETRSTRLLEGNAGTQAVRHERAEVRLPAGLADVDAAELRDELAKALVAQSVEVPTGHEVPLFRFPIGQTGLLGVTLGARAAQEIPSVRLSSFSFAVEKDGSHPRLILEYAREDHGAQIAVWASEGGSGETVGVEGATLLYGGGPGQPPSKRYRLEFDLPKTLPPDESEALRQRLSQKWLGQSLVIQPGERQTLFTVPAENGGTVSVTVTGKLPDVSR